MAHEDDLMKQKGTDFQEDSNQEEFTLPEEPTDESHTEGSEFEDDLDLGLGDDTSDDDLTFEEDGVYDETDDEYGEDHGEDLGDDSQDQVDHDVEEDQPMHTIGWKTYTALGLAVVLTAGGLSLWMFGGGSNNEARNNGISQAEAQEIIRQRAEAAITQNKQQTVSIPNQQAPATNQGNATQAPVQVEAFPDSRQSSTNALNTSAGANKEGSNANGGNGGAGNGDHSNGADALTADLENQRSVIPDPTKEQPVDDSSLRRTLDLQDMEDFQALSALANNNRERIHGLQNESSQKEEKIEDLDERVTILERKLKTLLANRDSNSAKPSTKISAPEKTNKTETAPSQSQEKAEKETGPVAYKPEVPETPAEVKALQRQLAIYGYKPGPIDGLLGSHTRAAIKRLQREHGLPDTGWLSGETLLALVKPRHYSGAYPEKEPVDFADHPRDEEKHSVTWFVRGVTPTKAVVYRLDGMSYAVSLGTEIPGMGQVTDLDPANHQVHTAHGTIGKR